MIKERQFPQEVELKKMLAFAVSDLMEFIFMEDEL